MLRLGFLAVLSDFPRSDNDDFIRTVFQGLVRLFIVFVCVPLCAFFLFFTMYFMYECHILIIKFSAKYILCRYVSGYADGSWHWNRNGRSGSCRSCWSWNDPRTWTRHTWCYSGARRCHGRSCSSHRHRVSPRLKPFRSEQVSIVFPIFIAACVLSTERVHCSKYSGFNTSLEFQDGLETAFPQKVFELCFNIWLLL